MKPEREADPSPFQLIGLAVSFRGELCHLSSALLLNVHPNTYDYKTNMIRSYKTNMIRSLITQSQHYGYRSNIEQRLEILLSLVPKQLTASHLQKTSLESTPAYDVLNSTARHRVLIAILGLRRTSRRNSTNVSFKMIHKCLLAPS